MEMPINHGDWFVCSLTFLTKTTLNCGIKSDRKLERSKCREAKINHKF